MVLIHGPADPGLAEIPLGTALAGGEFALVIKAPERQVVPRARFVPGRMP